MENKLHIKSGDQFVITNAAMESKVYECIGTDEGMIWFIDEHPEAVCENPGNCIKILDSHK